MAHLHAVCILLVLVVVLVGKPMSSTWAVSDDNCADICDYYAWGKDANCGQRNLQYIPQECKQAKTMRMDNNAMARLQTGAFQNFTCLKYLYFNRNNMTIDVGAFLGCNHLQVIEISWNFLPSLSEGLMEGLSEVLVMSIAGAMVKDVSTGAFRNLTKLQYLSLEDNQLTSPPCDAFPQDNYLKTLILSNNSISNLPNHCFADFSRLSNLYLKNNPLFDPNPLAFDGLDELKELHLQYTNLTVVPTGIFSYVRTIEKLYLSFNNIKHLGNRDFLSLTSLSHLDLQGNNLMTVHPKSFEFLLSLRFVNLSNNQIHSLGVGALSYCEQLEHAYLQENRLASTRNISFKTIPSESSIHLASNPLHCDCAIFPFKYRLERTSDDQSQDPSLLATCSSPEQFAGRPVIDLSHDDVCPMSPPAASSPRQEEPGTHPLMAEPRAENADPPTVVNVVHITAIVAGAVVFLIITIGIVVVCRMKKRADKKRASYSDSKAEAQIYQPRFEAANGRTVNVTTNPMAFPSRNSTAPLLPPRRPSEVTEATYISLDGDDQQQQQSLVHPPRPNSPEVVSPAKHPSRVPAPLTIPEEVAYSRVLPDNTQPTDEEPTDDGPSPAEWIQENVSPTSASVLLTPVGPTHTGYVPWKTSSVA